MMRLIPFLVLHFFIVSGFSQSDTIWINMNIDTDEELYTNDGGFEGGINTSELFQRQVSEGFNGIVVYEWTGISDTTRWVDKVHIIDQTACKCEDGFPVACLQVVYNYRFGKTADEKYVDKKALYEKGRPEHLTYYHDDGGAIASIQQKTLIRGVPYSHFVSFNEMGDTIVTGSYLDNQMHGRWCNWEYNLSLRTPVYEKWDHGKLVDIENSNVLFIGEEGEFISEKKFLAQVGDYPNWYVIGLNPEQRNIVHGYDVLMIIYSSTFDPDDEAALNQMLRQL